MRAITIREPGDPDVLAVADVPAPTPGPHEVLLDVVAAGVNRADLLQRAGHYPPPPGASEIPGLEVSGTVAAVGAEVTGWAVGDRVAALLAGGGYAERVVVPAGQLLPVPAGLDLVEAAALPEAVCTAWSNLVMVGGLSAGEWVLVHGGSGGVGTAALQLASALGARVATTAGGPLRAQACRDLGAEVAVDHREQDFTEVIAEATGGRGVDVVLDVIGAAYLDRNLRVLATGGRLVVIGLQRGRRAEIDLAVLLAKRATVVGTTLRSRPLAEKAEIVRQVRERPWAWLEDGRLRPVIHTRLPLDDAAAAHELLDTGAVFGKVVLTT